MSLATTDDYRNRHTAPVDEPILQTLLDDASSFVRQEARLHISAVDDDEVELRGDASTWLFLPEIPVRDVTAVEVDGEALAADAYDWTSYGRLERLGCQCWRRRSIIAVTYSHGFEEVPHWIVSLICSTVQRAVRPGAAEVLQSVMTGQQQRMYNTSLAGVNLWLTHAEIARLGGLRGPAFA